MKTNKNPMIRNTAILASPLLLFAVLVIPYSLANRQWIVDWLGCGCPRLDEFGNMVSPSFNANDFTALFWLFVALCVTAVSVPLSGRIPKERMWCRILYVAGMLLISLWIAFRFYRMMMWN